MNNPWDVIEKPSNGLASRRIDHTHPLEFFWGLDYLNHYLLVFASCDDVPEELQFPEITAAAKYFLALRHTANASYAIKMKYETTGGEFDTVRTSFGGEWTIDVGWPLAMPDPPLFTFYEFTYDVSSHVYYSERAIQSRYVPVPRPVQGWSIAFGIRSPSLNVQIHDFKMEVIDIGRDRVR